MKRLCICWILLICSGHGLNALTLSAALERTLEHNPLIQQSRTELEEAAGRRLVLRAIALPDAGARGPAGLIGGRRTETSSSIQAFGFVEGTFTQPLFNAAIPASYRRGDLELLIAKQQMNLTIIEQLHKTRIAFYTALYNRSLESLRRTQRQQLEENVRSQEARFQAGATDRTAFIAARVQARELDPQIETANRAHGAALLQLSEGMGATLGPGANQLDPEGELRFEPTAFSPDREITGALERRTDLKLARLVVRAANEDQRIVEAAYYPSIRAILAGNYIPVSGVRREGADSPHRSDDFISSEIRTGAAYNWRVIDNGKIGGAALRQEKAREINQLLLEKLELSVSRELSRIQNDFHAIEARHRSMLAAEKVAQENVGAVQQNLTQGLASQLEYRDAENSLLTTRDGILKAIYQGNVVRAEWERATGRYFQFSDDTAAKLH